ncbi:MAG: Mur ligase family protein, partial [Chloroflexota bacterium]
MTSEYFEMLRAIAQPIRATDLPHSLDQVQRLLDVIDKPQQHYPAVVVTGSTGKGTTCARLAQLLSKAGMKVGLYTSPHLHSFRERFVLLDESEDSALEMISQPEFVGTARRVLAAERALDTRYSTFETATAMALTWFAEQQIEIAVLEVGIGGRFDAVNAVANQLAVFTPIEAEHVAMLGGSLEAVAWHKAGIIQPNGAAVSVPQTPEVMAVLRREAKEKTATLEVGDDLLSLITQYTERRWRLKPPAISYVATDSKGRPKQIRQAQRSAPPRGLPGRLEQEIINGHSVMIDGGHTPNAAT